MVTTRHRLTMWAAVLLLPIACAVLYAKDPADGGIYPPCPFRAITGYDCPGCGTGRAMHQLLHGQVGAAVDLNLVAVAVLPVMLYLGASHVVRTLTGRALPTPKVPTWTPWVVTVVLMGWWVVRNLPFGPVAWFASYR